jgi:hypothetical protein
MSATLAMPMSALELRDAVRQSRRFTAAGLDRVLGLDASRGLVEVQASATWSGLALHLHPKAPGADAPWQGMPAIGESMAGNVAGPDGRPVVAYLESLALVTPDGELRRVARDTHADLFALAVGGQGLFGTPYSATLRLESMARAAAACEPAETLCLPASGGDTQPLHLLVPPAALERFLPDARSRCSEWRSPLEGVRVRRTLAEEETLLRWARREYAAVTLLLPRRQTLGGTVRDTQLRRELIDVAIAHGGSYPIACTPEATRAQAIACYPELKNLLAEKRRMDPCRKLSNEWYRHHCSLLGREDCRSSWNR